MNVNVNFNGVTYMNGVWSGTPKWTIAPNSIEVAPVANPAVTGDNTVTWNLNVSATPSGFSGKFPASGAIVFKPNSGWPGPPVGGLDEQTMQVVDNFAGLTENATYNYTITVVLYNTSGVVQLFTKDPDVENDAGTGSILHLVK